MSDVMHPSRTLRRLSAPLRYYLGGLWKRLNDEPVFIWAQAIAFKVLTTLLPLVLIATGVFGLVLRQEDPFDAVANYLRTFLPPGQSEPLVELLDRLQQTSPTLTVVGVGALVVLVVTLFSVLRYVVGTAMGAGRHRARSVLLGYLFDARMALQAGLLLLLSFGLTVGVNVLQAAGHELLLEWGLHPDVLRAGERLFFRVAALALPFVLSMAVFAQLFYFIPRPRPPAASALFGAFFTALLFEGAKNAFALYAATIAPFDRFTSSDEALGSVFGLLIAFVVWVYFSGLILIVGAMTTQLHERRHRPHRSRLRRLVRRILRRKEPRRPVGEPAGAPADTEAPNPAADTTPPPARVPSASRPA